MLIVGQFHGSLFTEEALARRAIFRPTSRRVGESYDAIVESCYVPVTPNRSLLRPRYGTRRMLRMRRIVLGVAVRPRVTKRGPVPTATEFSAQEGGTMTKEALTRESIALYGVPIALLLAPIITALFLPNSYQFSVPLLALGVGIVMRPRSLSIVLAGLYVVMLLAAVGAIALGRELPKIPAVNQGFAPAELLFIALLLFLYLTAVVALPMWIGRWARETFTHQRHRGPSPA